MHDPTDSTMPSWLEQGEHFDYVWQPWSPAVVRERLNGATVPWCFVGGWALDIWHGMQTRAHEDIEIMVPRGDFEELAAAFDDLRFDLIFQGRRWPVDHREAFDHSHQTWLFDPSTETYCLDVFRELCEGGDWVYRRNPVIRRPLEDVIEIDPAGVPYLAPEIVLLFKSKLPSDKDEFDFTRALPSLTGDQRRWLIESLRTVLPGHPWIARL